MGRGRRPQWPSSEDPPSNAESISRIWPGPGPGPIRPDHRAEDLTQILIDRLAGATGSITEYEWKTGQLLMQIYRSP
jgi:hypothetical protein